MRKNDGRMRRGRICGRNERKDSLLKENIPRNKNFLGC